mmetsp:Transcript_61739/g.133764  ORF Transcript_61739/g.133764 Transcript_61739/m.133764 type:complete len:461 (-) Transcript_61739:176-1558(-)|eukprot:CAMPEP_0170619280 /NCGR_PEP_ID=MMETSP0224-20130122/27433_1 /TAXON_ID=285029 /ORGANISM="Togula jolla, Strain CCCM 725" /LENGTH=460 /DNA_ID=CAMNT_0010945361 /DNA_START=62 /DNA_END=1444 /DNA_ORIENTATION=-
MAESGHRFFFSLGREGVSFRHQALGSSPEMFAGLGMLAGTAPLGRGSVGLFRTSLSGDNPAEAATTFLAHVHGSVRLGSAPGAPPPGPPSAPRGPGVSGAAVGEGVPSGPPGAGPDGSSVLMHFHTQILAGSQDLPRLFSQLGEPSEPDASPRAPSLPDPQVFLAILQGILGQSIMGPFSPFGFRPNEAGEAGGAPVAFEEWLQRLAELYHSASHLRVASSAQMDALLDLHVVPFESDEVTPCPICLDNLEAQERAICMPCCGNFFHRMCSVRWLAQESSRCPVCRRPLPEVTANEASAEAPPLDGAEAEALAVNSIAELKQRCGERGLDCSRCLEKSELVGLLLEERRTAAARLPGRGRGPPSRPMPPPPAASPRPTSHATPESTGTSVASSSSGGVPNEEGEVADLAAAASSVASTEENGAVTESAQHSATAGDIDSSKRPPSGGTSSGQPDKRRRTS